MTTKIKTSQSYFDVLTRAMRCLASDVVDQIATELLSAYYCDRAIFVFGNGGSAATASHFACDLAKGATKWLDGAAKRFRIVSLTDNVPLLTAWANDTQYADVFAEQLRNFVRADDLVMAISGSGNSPNVLNALQMAQMLGARTIGLTGFLGGKMISLCQHCVVVPSDNMEVIEDVHLAVCHSLTTILRTALSEYEHDRSATQMFHPMPRPDQSICSDSRTKRTTVFQMGAAPVSLPEFAPGPEMGNPRVSHDHVDAD